ncbi:hypothetical protein PSAC2689_30532 [Paraburkholderia sacchari]
MIMYDIDLFLICISATPNRESAYFLRYVLARTYRRLNSGRVYPTDTQRLCRSLVGDIVDLRATLQRAASHAWSHLAGFLQCVVTRANC